MKTKAESEKMIRHLCGLWLKERSVVLSPDVIQSFIEFKNWAGGKGYSDYFNFRSPRTGVSYDAEMWFDQEMNQAYRN
jgi:hypothetical protein